MSPLSGGKLSLRFVTFKQSVICVKPTLDERPHISIRDKTILSSERTLYKGYYRKSSVEKLSGRGYQGASRQDKLIGGKPAVAN
jgi:hypothetical protein